MIYFSKTHEYVRVEGEYGYVGITDYAQKQLGNIVYVDQPSTDDEIKVGDNFGAVESVKAASDLVAPVSGTVVETNQSLEDAPELLNQDAEQNWIIKVKLANPAELSKLMNEEQYSKFIG